MKSQLDLTAIKQIPIIDVAKRLGIQVKGKKAMCFMGHDKASPSLSFRTEHNTWRCFGACGMHGDNIALVMGKTGLDFRSAVTWLAQAFGVASGQLGQLAHGRIRLSRSKSAARVPIVIPQAMKEFACDPEVYEWLMDKCAEVSANSGVAYLNEHGISAKTAHRFGLRELRNPKLALRKLIERWSESRVHRSGLAWGESGRAEALIWSSYCILFPFHENNAITYLQARMLEGRTKFLNLRGLDKPLFNGDRLGRLEAGTRVHICEGVPDAIALESQGLSAVGVLGAHSFRADWVSRFLKFDVVILGDGDSAGDMFGKKVSKLFEKRGKVVQRLQLPLGEDVANVIARAGGRP